MRSIIRLIFWLVIVLIIFAVVPDSFWNWLKPFFNWEKFLDTIKLGFQKIANLLKGIGLDLSQIDDKIKEFSGIDLSNIWQGIKNFFSGIFGKIGNIIK